MNFTGLSATAIWASPVRNLTGLGLNTIQFGSSVNASLAANATVTLQQPSGKGTIRTIGVVADASGSMTIQFTDGTNTWTAVTAAAGTTGGQDFTVSDSLCYWQIHNNSATVAGHYFTSGYGLLM